MMSDTISREMVRRIIDSPRNKKQMLRMLESIPSAEPTFDARDTQYSLPIGTDCISRQAAIDAANRTDYNGLAVEDVCKVTDAVVEEIKRLPSAQPEPHWIPCSERLPKKEGFYLVTLGYKHGAETNIRYFKIENGKCYWSIWGNENITAWMPKPEPFKGVTE